MHRHLFPRAMMIIIVLALLSFTAVAAAGQAVPFNLSTVFAYTGSHGNTLLYEGTSAVTHLGLCDQVVEVQIKSNAKSDSAQGSMVLTDPSGDQLYLVFQQVGDPVLQAFVGTYSITGGTGRFADASGTGSIVSAPQADGTILTACSGNISY